MPASPCLSEESVAELVEGRLHGERLAIAERHLVGCAECRTLVSSMAKAAPEATTDREGDGGASERPVDPPVLERNDLVGRYVVLDLVGAGAMGRVYAAHDPALDRKVALKLLRPEMAVPDLESRLLREAKAMARISHPHVIAVHDAGRHGDQVYIAMEFVAGGTLREWLDAKPRSWREILDVYLRAGRGLAEAHAAGIVHRDFKPDNVLVGDDGRVVRVTDFGLARSARSYATPALAEADTVLATGDDRSSLDAALTVTGALLGTPVYMAPEQLAGDVADARSDVYSFCVALYEALYGERPFSATTLLALHAVKVAGKVRPPPEGRRIPQRLRRALLAGLSAAPESRPASMDALLESLTRAARRPRAPWVVAAAGLAIGAAWIAVGAGARDARPRASTPASAALASPPPECLTHRACVEQHGGEPWLCRAADHTCAPVASGECKAYFEPGDLQADDTIWVGAMFPSAAEEFGRANANAVELARREFAHATRALTGSNASQRVRRVALALCDDSDPEGAKRAARHLVEDVGVPAILGFRSGDEIIDLTGSLLVRRNVLSVASLSTNPLVTQIPQPPDVPRLVWRTAFNLGDVAVATAGFVRDHFEPRRSAAPTRVLLLRGEATGNIAFGQTLMKKLVFNGKSGVDNGADYQEIALGRDAGADSSAVARVVDRVVAMAPSFVVLFTELDVALVTAIEARWKPGVPRPTYFVAADAPDRFAPLLDTSVDRRRRVLGVVSTSTSAANAHFVMRYNEAFENHVSRTENPGSSYDAFYLLAFAANATSSEAIAGVDLARAFDRLLPPGRPIEVGPTQVFEALSELARGGRIDLEGTNTALDFDVATGEAPSDFALVCAAVDRAGRATGSSVESGLVFRTKTQRVDGALRCP